MKSIRDLYVGIQFKDEATKGIKNVNKSMDAVKKSFDNVNKTTGRFSKAMGTVGTTFKQLRNPTTLFNKAVGNIRQSLERLKNPTALATRSFDLMKRSMGKLKNNMGPVFQNMGRGALDQVKRLGGAFRNLPSAAMGGIRKVGSSITSMLTAPMRGAVGMVQQYAGALGLLSGGALAATGIDRLSSLENSKISLGVMMGDEGKASKFMDDVLAFAKTTPFAFPDLAESARNLYAFGMDEARIIPTMKAIGDAAAASGKGSEGLNQVAAAFGDMQIAGYLGMDQINRLQSGGVPALKILANQFGLTTDEMKKKISDGSVESVKAIDMLVEGMQEGTKGVAGDTAAMAGIMEKTKETWTGSVDSLKSSISSTMATLMEPLMPSIQGFMKWFGDTFSKLPTIVFGAYNAMKPAIEGFKQTFNDIKGVITSVFEGNTGQSTNLLQQMGLSPDMAAQVTSVLNGIRSGFMSFRDSVAEVLQGIATNAPAILSGFQSYLAGIAPIVSAVGSVLRGVGEVIMSLVQNVIVPLLPIAYSIMSSVFTAISPVVAVVANVFSTLVTIIRGLVENVIAPLLPVAGSIITTVMGVITPIIRIAASIFDLLWGSIQYLVQNIVVPLFPVISTIISGVWSVIKPILDGMAEAFNAIADAVEWAVGKFNGFKEAVSNFKMPSFGMPKWMGGNGFIQSHATGLERVPYDGYTAELHKDESVLTAKQSEALRNAGILSAAGERPRLNFEGQGGGGAAVSGGTNVNGPVNFYIQSSDPEGVRREVENIFRRLNAGLA